MKKKRIDILFLILDLELLIENSSVFQAQIIDQLIALKKIGYSTAILCAKRDHIKFYRVAGNKLQQYGVTVCCLPDHGLLMNVLAFALRLRRFESEYQIGRIYIRSFWAAYPILMTSLLEKLEYVYDIRGDIIDESNARGRGAIRQFILLLLERFAIRYAIQLSCVATPLANLIFNRAKLRVLPEVIPCCVDLSQFSYSDDVRAIRRKELGYTHRDIVLVYSGGIAQYQMLPEMLSLWRNLLSASSRIKFLLMINSDQSSIGRFLNGSSDFGNRLQILNLPRDEIFPTLCASDIGFLLREDRTLNASASPVKFAEYLSAGLAVVSSPGIGDISSQIIENRLGVLVNPHVQPEEADKVDKFIQTFDEDRFAIRLRALKFAKKSYGWDSYSKIYQKLYGLPSKI